MLFFVTILRFLSFAVFNLQFAITMLSAQFERERAYGTQVQCRIVYPEYRPPRHTVFFFTSDTVIDTLRHSFSRCNLNVNVAPSNPLCTPGSLQLALRLFSLSSLKMYKLFYRLFIIFIVITMSVNDDTWLYT